MIGGGERLAEIPQRRLEPPRLLRERVARPSGPPGAVRRAWTPPPEPQRRRKTPVACRIHGGFYHVLRARCYGARLPTSTCSCDVLTCSADRVRVRMLDVARARTALARGRTSTSHAATTRHGCTSTGRSGAGAGASVEIL